MDNAKRYLSNYSDGYAMRVVITVRADVAAGAIMGSCIALEGKGAVCVQGQAGDSDASLAVDGVTARFLESEEYSATSYDPYAGITLTANSNGLTRTPEGIYGENGVELAGGLA